MKKRKKDLDELLIELMQSETDRFSELAELDESCEPVEPDWVRLRKGELYQEAYLRLSARLDYLLEELEAARDDAEEFLSRMLPLAYETPPGE